MDEINGNYIPDAMRSLSFKTIDRADGFHTLLFRLAATTANSLHMWAEQGQQGDVSAPATGWLMAWYRLHTDETDFQHTAAKDYFWACLFSTSPKMQPKTREMLMTARFGNRLDIDEWGIPVERDNAW